MDRYLVTGAILLLLLLSTWLLDDLKVVDLHLSQFSGEQLERKPIGKILSTRQEVKRKNQQSLTWEETTSADTLYYYDAVLTLSQSAAVLKVESETEITMSENTLVVLEPSENSEIDKLRLVFSKGDINALNPNKKALIESNSWTIEAQKGSELNIRSDDLTGKMQIEVKSGKARVASTKPGPRGSQNADSVRELEKNQILEVDQNRIVSQTTLTGELDWNFKQDLIRIYSHRFPINFPFEWRGDAQKISLVGPQKEQTEIALNATSDVHKKNLLLKPGLYLARLINKEQTSRLLRLQVWQAPLVHLLSPLPRDRLQTEIPHSFSWSEGKGAVSYSLDFLDPVTKNLKRTEKTEGLGIKISEKAEISYQWQIEAFDEDGFVIPSLYANDVYFVNDPLKAPRLKAVRAVRSTRTPADDSKKKLNQNKSKQKTNKPETSLLDAPKRGPISTGTPLWTFFQILFRLEIAQAAGGEHLNQEKQSETKINLEPDPTNIEAPPKSLTPPVVELWEATFEWERVEGASFYQIEVSKLPNFQNPEVSERVKNPIYSWEFKDLGTYYWRVAAVKFNGQVGLFSEVAKAELKSESSNASSGVTLRKIQAPATPPAAKEEVKAKTPTKKPDPLLDWDELWLSPGYSYSSLGAQKGAKATLIGPVIYGLGIQRDLDFDDADRWSLVGQASYVQWKPTPTDQFPFQEKLIDWSVELNFLKRIAGNSGAWGLGLERTSSLWKTDLESLELRPRYLAGPAYLYEFSPHSWLRTSFLSDLKFFQLLGIYHTQRFLSDHFFYGAEFQPMFTGGLDVDLGWRMYIRILLGWEF